MGKALVLGLALALALAGGSTAALRLQASLRIVRLEPVTVRGVHFRAGERIQVTLIAQTRRLRRAVASPTGSFTVRFADTSLDPCSAFLVRAIGSGGSRALLKVQPECPPA